MKDISKFRSMINLASTKPNSVALMQELTTIMEDHFVELEAAHPKLYWEVMNDIHVLVNGTCFDEVSAKYAVSQMDNEDGTKGEHWTIVDTTNAAKSVGITFDTFNEWDWYYVLNMIYSDHFKTIGSNTSMYVSFARDWLMDKDAPKGKVFLYYAMILENS